jgi:hypothetical protein
VQQERLQEEERAARDKALEEESMQLEKEIEREIRGMTFSKSIIYLTKSNLV